MSIDRYVVMGNPIAHSRSPIIHRLFATQTGQQLSYETLLVPLDGFARALTEFARAGGKGANVTVPFKEEAWREMTTRTERAARAQAVNTIILRDDGMRFGDNTDGVGLVRDLSDNLRVNLQGKRILLLGAGGAARGVLEPLLAAAPKQLTIANRTADKASALATAFGDLGTVTGHGFDKLRSQQFDIVINATAASLQGEVPPLPNDIVASNGCCYDMMYGKAPTPFMQWAQQRGVAQTFDGLGMLVEQAAEAFLLWRGVMPKTAPVIAELRRLMIAQ